MKHVLFVLIVAALVAGSLFAAGAEESPREITLLTSTPLDAPDMAYALGRFKNDYPGVEVIMNRVDLSDGSTLTMDAMLAAGRAPNIYQDYIGRVSKYLVPEFALDLTGNVRDLAQYNDGVLGPYTRDGKVLGLPQPGGAQGMAINLDIMNEIGFAVHSDWTIDEFLVMCELVKRKYGGEKFGTGMFAGNQSGDYLINNWFAAFGVKYYNPGDYSKTTIAEGGEKVYEFFQLLVRNGYVPPSAATLVDDDYVIQWAKGELAATAFFPAWAKPYFDTVIAQGQLKEPFNYAFVAFPRAPGVKQVPTYISNAAIVVRRTGTKQDAWAARFAEYLNDSEAQSMVSVNGAIPNRKDAQMRNENPRVMETALIAQRNGIMDVGLTTPAFAATRPQHYPVLQKVLTLSITPADAIREYEARLNEALK